jgi:hypothetical protein
VNKVVRFAVVVGIALTASGCINPLAPSIEHTPINTCYTQPRLYCTPGGDCRYEVDHYEQYPPCPKERVK